jgi:DnaK suppressor protein
MATVNEGGVPDIDTGAILRLLTDRRRELEVELDRLTEPPAEGASVAFGKRVGDGTSEAVERLSTTAAARSIAASIADIDGALAKIEAGTYGTCDGCANLIGAPRLEALPAASLCITCSGRKDSGQRK